VAEVQILLEILIQELPIKVEVGHKDIIHHQEENQVLEEAEVHVIMDHLLEDQVDQEVLLLLNKKLDQLQLKVFGH
jgi:hypothetical protein